MLDPYARQKIAEALENSEGSDAVALKLVAQMCQNDPQLLHALAGPHLKGIIAHAIQHVQRAGVTDRKRPDTDPESNPFGKNLLQALGGSGVKFGEEDAGAPIGKRQASERHIEAIRRMARRTPKSSE